MRKSQIHLLHKRLVGDYLDDMGCIEQQRLEFYRWLYQRGRLSDFTTTQPRLVRRPNWWNVPSVPEEPASQWETINAALTEAFGW